MIKTVLFSALAWVVVQEGVNVDPTAQAAIFAAILGAILGLFRFLEWTMARRRDAATPAAGVPVTDGLAVTLRNINSALERTESALSATTTALALIQERQKTDGREVRDIKQCIVGMKTSLERINTTMVTIDRKIA